MFTPYVSIISIIGFVILFLILREFFCWYYKINKRLSLMQRQLWIMERWAEKEGIELEYLPNFEREKREKEKKEKDKL